MENDEILEKWLKENDEIFEKWLKEVDLENCVISYPTNCTIWVKAFTRIKILEKKVANLESIIDKLLA